MISLEKSYQKIILAIPKPENTLPEDKSCYFMSRTNNSFTRITVEIVLEKGRRYKVSAQKFYQYSLWLDCEMISQGSRFWRLGSPLSVLKWNLASRKYSLWEPMQSLFICILFAYVFTRMWCMSSELSCIPCCDLCSLKYEQNKHFLSWISDREIAIHWEKDQSNENIFSYRLH